MEIQSYFKREMAILVGGAVVEAALLWALLSHQAFAYSREESLRYFGFLGALAAVPFAALGAAHFLNGRRVAGKAVKIRSIPFVVTGVAAAGLAILLIHGAAGVLFIGYCAQVGVVLSAWVRLWHAA